MPNLYIPIFSLIIITLVNIVFFSKKRIFSNETKFYKIMLISSLIDSLLLSIIVLLGYIGYYSMLEIKILNKIDFIMYLIWITVFLMYYLNVFNNNKNKKSISRIIICISSIFSLGIVILPVNPVNSNGVMFVTGLSVNILYSLVVIYILFMILILIFNIKNIFNKKNIPLFFFIILIILTLIIRNYNPSLLITSAILSLINLIMYFTIENPDMKMLEEIENNRNLIERGMEEKSNLLFKISQDVRIPINNIEQISNEMINKKKVSDLVNNAKIINSESKNVSFIVNNLLDISSMNINNIKLYKTKININTLLKEIDLMFNKKDFKYSILNTIPDIYGDNVRLKQIIASIINYEYEHNSNSVFLELSGIIRYDMCRLSINIISDGDKLDLLEINNILDSETDINIDMNNLQLDLISIKTLINLLNGSFNIKSDDKGNTYSIILDSEIVKKDNINITNNYINKKRVLLIDDDIEELKIYSKILKKYNIDITTSMFGNDVINRIDNKEEYDLIIIDDEMQPYNAVKTIEERPK